MDFLSLPITTDAFGDQYDTVFVVVDRLSGYIQAIPCLKRGLDATVPAKLFVKNCVMFSGLPSEVLSDNDDLISSKFFQTVCDMLGIYQNSAIIYRPNGNGRAGRAVRSVINTLRLTLTRLEQVTSWKSILQRTSFLEKRITEIYIRI